MSTACIDCPRCRHNTITYSRDERYGYIENIWAECKCWEGDEDALLDVL